MRRRVATNLLWMLIERGLQVATGIGVVAMLARALGPEGFAHFQYAQAIVLIAASLALICGGEVVVPRLVVTPTAAGQHRLMMHALVLRIGGAALGYLLMCTFLLVTRPPPETWIAALLLGISILLREPAGVVVAWMQAHTNNRPGTIFSLVALIAKAGLVASLFLAGTHNVPLFAATFAVEPIVLASLLFIYYLSRTPGGRRVQLEPALCRQLVSAGTLFWIGFILMMGARRADQLILQPSVPLTEFSAYAASMQILDNFTIVATILAGGIAPMYIYSKNALSVARQNVAYTALGLGLIGLVGAVMIASSAEWIIHLLYGSEFSSASRLLQVAALASIPVFADVGLSLLAVYLRRPKWIAMKWGLVLSVTIVFDLIAVPRYGAMGAIAGYAVSNAMAVCFGLVLWWRTGRSVQMATA
ncbi:lipopolysaccharide biosynthesis protein [Cupriavidus agavae]|uniref:PST family polysaccharide transporter n=1 Tax=Cupriavidus agavae TaxID=1001822 RepID=A0A4Q7S4P5_9BURK|nr:lipopolysaccharide biosynthesis protein [Cupriavidus agavae]RZT41355.1 PST family polysaccharide transporter [Cupriavidus agavae]